MTSAVIRLSMDEFLALPAKKPYREFLRGEVTEKPMVNRTHGRLTSWLIYLLTGYLMESGEGKVENEVRHADRRQDWVYLPDINVTLEERYRPTGRGPVEDEPDFAIEVLSPDDHVSDVMERVELYLAAGTRLLWIVDPERRAITAYSPDKPVTVYHVGDTAGAEPVLRAFELDVSALFAVLDAGPPG